MPDESDNAAETVVVEAEAEDASKTDNDVDASGGAGNPPEAALSAEASPVDAPENGPAADEDRAPDAQATGEGEGLPFTPEDPPDASPGPTTAPSPSSEAPPPLEHPAAAPYPSAAAQDPDREGSVAAQAHDQERVGSAAPPELRHLLLKAETGLGGELAQSLGLSGYGRSQANGSSKATRLRFYSWWYEDVESNDLTLRVSTNQEVGGGLKRRYITVDYDVETQSFSLRSADDEHVLLISNILAVTNKFGSNVEMWDLYVGATLVIMGKSVTLLKADISTSTWIDQNTKRLNKLRKDLFEELQKYKPRAHSNALVFDKGTKRDAGGQSLRLLIDQINTLLDDLKQYRPGKAEQFRARIGMS